MQTSLVRTRDVVALFNQVADMLSIRGDQIHRILAYRKAAESIEGLGRDINQVYAEGGLRDIPGVGETLAAKIEEYLTTGKLEFYDKLAQDVPPSLVDLLRVEGLGPKRVKQLYETLNITTVEQLLAAARAGKLRDLPGMGAKTEEKIIHAIEALARHGDTRTPLGVALPIAEAMLAALMTVPGVTRGSVGGSLRRMRDTIGDIDLLVAAADPSPVMDRLAMLDLVESVHSRGPTKSRVILLNGLGVDLRVLPAERWGTLQSYFTGSQAHNIRLRELALRNGLSLNEHAFTPVDGGAEMLCETEEDVYRTLGLPYIPPTLREDRGEIEAALAGALPDLIRLDQLKTDLHVHTTWSDGKLSIREMAEAARARGLTGIVITDHSASLGIANGLSIERLRAQAEEVRAVDAVMGPDFRVLHGTEAEIRADGSLDYPDEVLAELDIVIASLHTSLGQSREQITQRLIGAMRNPHVDVIGHPTGRLFPDRPGADLDMELVLSEAAAYGTILEVNANPNRLDLNDVYIQRAVKLGVKLAINTDAHQPTDYDFSRYGVATAQRGWATAADIVNTSTLDDLLARLAAAGKGRA